jgi:NMD protein affecting ribosome stability and mRNA decay
MGVNLCRSGGTVDSGEAWKKEKEEKRKMEEMVTKYDCRLGDHVMDEAGGDVASYWL